MQIWLFFWILTLTVLLKKNMVSFLNLNLYHCIIYMKDSDNFRFSIDVILYPLLFVLLIWVVFWFEIRFGYDFNHWGVVPRNLKGLRGILFSPLIHADIAHLWNNTLPLFILSSALLFFYKNTAWRVIILGTILTGLITWILGRPANHIGASGLIYMLLSFLFFKGILAKHYRLIALSFVVVFIYGGMVWYVLPIDTKISWEGHLSGLLVGALLSIFMRKGIAKPKLYSWEEPDFNPEEDEFLQHFDENGNFIEKLLQEDTEEDNELEIVYNYRLEEKNDKK